MKKERFFENLIMESKKVTNRKLVVRVAVIAVLILAMAVTTGCGKKKNKENTTVESSQSVTQEVTPSTSEAQESTAEVVESSETVESTEETKSEVNLVEKIDTNKYDGFLEWLVEADYDEPKLTVWLDNTAFLLSDGASYKGEGSICLCIPGGTSNVKDVSSNVYIEERGDFYLIPTVYLKLNEENEITCNITYNDDTQDTITVYFTWIEE